MIYTLYLYRMFLSASVVNVSKFKEGEYAGLADHAQEAPGAVLASEVVEAVPVHQLPVAVAAVGVVSHHTHLSRGQ